MNWTMILLRAMLLFVLYTQVTHQRLSLGDPTFMNYAMAATIEISISVISSAVLSIIMGSSKPSRFLALLALPALIWCMTVSYEASVAVFHKNRLDQVQGETKSLASKLSENRAIGANNTIVALAQRGVTSGPEYEAATAELEAGLGQMKANEGDKNASTTAQAITGGDTGALDEKVLHAAKQRAFMLIVLTLALSGLSGLWSGLTAGWRNIDIGAMPGKLEGHDSAQPKASPKIKPKARPMQRTNHKLTAGIKDKVRAIQAGTYEKPKTAITPVVITHREPMGKEPSVETDQDKEDREAVLAALTNKKGGMGFGQAEAKKLLESATGTTQSELMKSALKNKGVSSMSQDKPRAPKPEDDDSIHARAKIIGDQIKAGTLVHCENKKPLTGHVSQRAISDQASSKETARKIFELLQKQGLMKIDPNGKAMIVKRESA